MVRSILGTPSAKLTLSTATPHRTTSSTLTVQQVEAHLRQPRSRTYIEAMQKLDAGGHVHDRAALDALLEAIGNELPGLSLEVWPLGIVSKCYLGAPYEVHCLDRAGNIIRHYKAGSALPDGMERARALAFSAHYAFIEVYSDKLIAVAANGDTSLIKD